MESFWDGWTSTICIGVSWLRDRASRAVGGAAGEDIEAFGIVLTCGIWIVAKAVCDIVLDDDDDDEGRVLEGTSAGEWRSYTLRVL